MQVDEGEEGEEEVQAEPDQEEPETPNDADAEAQRIEEQNRYDEQVEAINQTIEKEWPSQMTNQDRMMVRCYAKKWICCCDHEQRCYPHPTCHRPPWNFKDGKNEETCCKTCWDSLGASHGPSCNRNWERLQKWIIVLTTKHEEQREEVLEQLIAEDEEDRKIVFDSLSDVAKSAIATLEALAPYYARLPWKGTKIVNDYWWKAVQKKTTKPE